MSKKGEKRRDAEGTNRERGKKINENAGRYEKTEIDSTDRETAELAADAAAFPKMLTTAMVCLQDGVACSLVIRYGSSRKH